MFILRATIHNSYQTIHSCLKRLGQDPILNSRHEVDWEAIEKRKQDLINKVNEKNHNHMKYTYKQKTTSYLKTRGRQNLIKTSPWVPF